MKEKKVLISIANYNGTDDTIELLESLFKIDYKNFNILIYDNNSEKKQIFKLKEYIKNKKKIILVKSKLNQGLTGSGNFSIEYALKNNFEYILFMNNDMIVEKNFLKILVGRLSSTMKIAAVGPAILYASKPKIIWSGEIKYSPLRFKPVSEGLDISKENKQFREVDALDCVFLANLKIMKEIGGFFPDFFMIHEYTGWCLNAKKKGYKIIYDPKSVVWHKVSKSISGLNDLTTYLTSRNWLSVSKKTQSKSKYFLAFLLHLFLSIPRKVKALIKKRKFSLKQYYFGILDHLKNYNKYL